MGGTEVINGREEELVLDVIRRGKIFRYAYNDRDAENSYAWRFEKSFRDFVGTAHALAVSSGSAALRCGLEALDVGPGDEVVLPAYTFVASAEAVMEAGARPVLAEIDDSFNVDPDDAAGRITERTRALMPVHMMGAAAEMESLTALAGRHRLRLLEDACQAVGASWRGRFVGTIGDAGAFSFDSAKLLTCAEGGMLVTGEKSFYDRADRYHDHGHVHDLSRLRGREPKEGTGFNFRLSELHAAFGLAQLEKLPGMISSLRAHRARLKELVRLPDGFRYRRFHDESDIATFLCLVAPDREQAGRVRSRLESAGVNPATLNYWHYQANLELVGAAPGAFPRTRALLDRAVVLEIKVGMSEEQIRKTADALNLALNG